MKETTSTLVIAKLTSIISLKINRKAISDGALGRLEGGGSYFMTWKHHYKTTGNDPDANWLQARVLI